MINADLKSVWIVSLSDYWKAVKGGKKKIALAALFAAIALFSRSWNREPRYNAEGIFQGTQGSSNQSFSFSSFTQGSGSGITDDPILLFNSYPVMERVVKKLDLQATLIEHTKGSFFNRFKNKWNNLLIEGEYRQCLKSMPPSEILNELSTDHLVVDDKQRTLICRDVCFSDEHHRLLDIHFSDELSFDVFEGKTKIAYGRLNEPTFFGQNSFTLTKANIDAPLKSQSFSISFVPLVPVVKSLTQSVHCQPDKKKNSLLNISFTHRDRHLATAIVNAAMDSYHEFLIQASEEKCKKQLLYLDNRQKNIKTDFQKLTTQHQEFLKEHVQAYGFMDSESETKYVTGKQAECHAKSTHILHQMQLIDEIGSQKEENFSNLLEKIRELKKSVFFSQNDPEALSIEAIKPLLASYQTENDLLELQHKRCDFYIEKLKNDSYEIDFLITEKNESALNEHFQKIHKLYFQLLDKNNWSAREHERIKEELETEKRFLVHLLARLKEGCLHNEQLLQEKIQQLKKKALFLLLEEYETLQLELKELAHRTAGLPTRWLKDQLLRFEIQTQQDLLSSLLRMVETKNLASYMQNFSSGPLQYAIAKTLPNHPHLIRNFILGGLIGAFFCTVFLIVQEFLKGASASLTNLKEAGFTCLGQFTSSALSFETLKKEDRETLKNATFFLTQHKPLCPLVLHSSKKETYFLRPLLCLLGVRQEKILCLSLAQGSGDFFDYLEGKKQEIEIHKQDNFDLIAANSSYPFKEEMLQSPQFEQWLIKTRAHYDWIFIQTFSNPEDLEIQILSRTASHIIYGVTHERLHQLSTLGRSTLFFVQKQESPVEFAQLFSYFKQQKEIQLRKLAPILEELKQNIYQNSYIKNLFTRR